MSWTYEKDQPLITDFNAQYINIPIAYNVSFFTKNKHQMYLTLGFNSSFQIKSDEVTISGFGYKETETKYLNPVLFDYRTGLRYAYRINDILKVKCEPKLTYYKNLYDMITDQKAFAIQAYLAAVYMF